MSMATNPSRTHEASRMRLDPVVADLVNRARTGERQAWDAMVERYAPLIWSICREYQLDAADAEDAAQSIWLKLVDHLGSLRDPAALPGWLATTTRRECGRILRATRRPAMTGMRQTPGPSPAITPGRQSRTCSRPSATRPCARRSGSFPQLPAADCPAHPRPCSVLYPDQRQAGHPGRQHRAEPAPLPGQAAPPPGHRRAHQRRRLDRHVRCILATKCGKVISTLSCIPGKPSDVKQRTCHRPPELLNCLDCCGHLCAGPDGPPRPSSCGPPLPRSSARRRRRCARRRAPSGRTLRAARQALGPDRRLTDRTRAVEERGAAMSLATAAKHALILTAPPSPQALRPSSPAGNRHWSGWPQRAVPTRISPRSSTSASGPSAPTWTGSGTRPAAAAAPT